MEAVIQRRHGLRFNPEINAGHLLTMVTMVAAIASMWFSFDKRLALTEQVVAQLKDQIVITAMSVKQNSDTQAQIVRTVDRLGVLVDEAQKRK